MSDSTSDERQEYLARLCREIFALTDRLADAEQAGVPEYLDTFKKLQGLKERYKQLTGIYPILPSSPTRP